MSADLSVSVTPGAFSVLADTATTVELARAGLSLRQVSATDLTVDLTAGLRAATPQVVICQGIGEVAVIRRARYNGPLITLVDDADDTLAALRAGSYDTIEMALLSDEDGRRVALRRLFAAISRPVSELADSDSGFCFTGAQDRLERLIAARHDVITLMSASGEVIYVSPAARAMFGFVPERFDAERIHPEDRPTVAALYRELMEGPSGVHIELLYRLCSVDGGWRWVHVQADNCTADPVLSGILLVHRDVTSTVEAERAAAGAYRLAQAAFDLSPVGVILIRPDDTYVAVNQAFADMVGRSREELAGMKASAVTHPDDLDVSRRLLAERPPGQVLKGDKRYLRPDGTVVWAHLTVSVLDTEGIILPAGLDGPLLLGQVFDVSERVRHEEQMEALNTTLAAKVAQLDTARANQHRLALVVAEAAEVERQRIRTTLHDDAVQQLVGATWALEGALPALERSCAPEAAAVVKAVTAVQGAQAAIHAAMNALRPSVLEELDLAVALRSQLDSLLEADVLVASSIADDLILPAAAAALVLRIVREGVHNIRKHAQASHVSLAVTVEAGQVRVRLSDDGVGVTPKQRAAAERAGHVGLTLLAEAVAAAEGTLAVRPGSSAGTVLEALIPLPTSDTRSGST